MTEVVILLCLGLLYSPSNSLLSMQSKKTVKLSFHGKQQQKQTMTFLQLRVLLMESIGKIYNTSKVQVTAYKFKSTRIQTMHLTQGFLIIRSEERRVGKEC